MSQETIDWEDRGAVATKIECFVTASGEWATKGKEQRKLISKVEGRPGLKWNSQVGVVKVRRGVTQLRIRHEVRGGKQSFDSRVSKGQSKRHTKMQEGIEMQRGKVS